MSKQLHELSDEELMALDPATITQEEEQPTDTEEEVTEESQTEPEQTPEPSDEVFEETEQPQSESTEETEEPVNEDTQTQTDEASEDIEDYKSFYSIITRPFKANGKEVQITDPNDIIRLVQQGMNYSKKMAEMKPNMGIIKTLQEHGLLDGSKLSYLIDLHNKKPEAIAKLVKDSEIDLYSFDADQGDSYIPQNQVQPYSDLELVIADLQQNSESAVDMINRIADTWDSKSKQVINDNPEVLRILDQHYHEGIFDKAMAAVETEYMLGRVPANVPMINVYHSISDTLIQKQQQQQPQQQPKAFTAPRPAQSKPVSNPNNNNNKNKAAMPSASGNNNNNNNINPLAMSDEELLQYMSTLT